MSDTHGSTNLLTSESNNSSQNNLNKQPTVGSLVDLGNAMHDARRGNQPEVGVPAGYTYFGQFVDHDITFLSSSDRAPDGEFRTNSADNLVTPVLDLSSVYGDGLSDRRIPVDSETGEMVLDPTISKFGAVLKKHKYDLPRKENKIAKIGDPRNDENLIIAQMHVLFLRFHNALVSLIDSDDPAKKYKLARETVIQIYKVVITDDFLAKVLHPDIWKLYIGSSNTFPNYWLNNNSTPVIPKEFNGAAYRFGHAMVRTLYFLNEKREQFDLNQIFFMTGRNNLAGSSRLPLNNKVHWANFFELSTLKPMQANRIEPKVKIEIPSLEWPANRLAIRNLLRGRELGLQSGQVLHKAFLNITKFPEKVHQLLATCTPEIVTQSLEQYESEIADWVTIKDNTPLWYYCLSESYQCHNGLKLGPLASIIVAETFSKIIKLSNQQKNSILHNPTNPSSSAPKSLFFENPWKEETTNAELQEIRSMSKLINFVEEKERNNGS